VSWIVHNDIWAVLVSSGVFAIPFIAIIIQEWLKTHTEGATEGNKYLLSRAITGTSVAAIPYGTDLRQICMNINATRIDDPILAQEVDDFTHDCYGPARAKLFMPRLELDKKQMHDVSWIGSNYFTDTFSYYDNYHSSTPPDARLYDSTDDVGLAQVPSGSSYPTCQQWWNDGGDGLRARLLKQVAPPASSIVSRARLGF